MNMKHYLLACAILGVALSVSAAEPTYHFNAYVFDTQQLYKPAGEGDGNPDVCKHMFTPPMSYDGRYIQIPTNATVFGVIAVTDGNASKIIPLFAWSDEKGAKQFGCNGPTIWYARQEDSAEKLLNSIVKAIKKKDSTTTKSTLSSEGAPSDER
jgi:hypothetical protein